MCWRPLKHCHVRIGSAPIVGRWNWITMRMIYFWAPIRTTLIWQLNWSKFGWNSAVFIREGGCATVNRFHYMDSISKREGRNDFKDVVWTISGEGIGRVLIHTFWYRPWSYSKPGGSLRSVYILRTHHGQNYVVWSLRFIPYFSAMSEHHFVAKSTERSGGRSKCSEEIMVNQLFHDLTSNSALLACLCFSFAFAT